jgi:hypothetical protein
MGIAFFTSLLQHFDRPSVHTIIFFRREFRVKPPKSGFGDTAVFLAGDLWIFQYQILLIRRLL